MSRVIQQNIKFAASPKTVFDAIIKGQEFAKVTGEPATSSAEPGAEVSLFGGKIAARNLDIVPGERIVQAWRSLNWDEGVYSIVRFELDGGDGETELKFEHVGFPDGQHDFLAGGWHKMYWEPLQAYFAS